MTEQQPVYLLPTTVRVVAAPLDFEPNRFVLRVMGKTHRGEGTFVDIPMTTRRLATLIHDSAAAIIDIEGHNS